MNSPRVRHVSPARPMWLAWAALALTVIACGPRFRASEPIPGTHEACCSEADRGLKHFKGCRPTGRCKTGEPFWMRGAVTCGPVDEAACAGGRCCEYVQRVDYGDKPETDADRLVMPAPVPIDSPEAGADPGPPETTEPADEAPSDTKSEEPGDAPTPKTNPDDEAPPPPM